MYLKTWLDAYKLSFNIDQINFIIFNVVNREMTHLKTWLDAYKLSFNIDKANFMISSLLRSLLLYMLISEWEIFLPNRLVLSNFLVFPKMRISHGSTT